MASYMDHLDHQMAGLSTPQEQTKYLRNKDDVTSFVVLQSCCIRASHSALIVQIGQQSSTWNMFQLVIVKYTEAHLSKLLTFCQRVPPLKI